MSTLIAKYGSFIATGLGLIVSALIAYGVSVGSTEARMVNQDKKIEAIETQQKELTVKIDHLTTTLHNIDTNTKVTRSKINDISMTVTRLEGRVDYVINGRSK